jgi:hypothetical protein
MTTRYSNDNDNNSGKTDNENNSGKKTVSEEKPLEPLFSLKSRGDKQVYYAELTALYEVLRNISLRALNLQDIVERNVDNEDFQLLTINHLYRYICIFRSYLQKMKYVDEESYPKEEIDEQADLLDRANDRKIELEREKERELACERGEEEAFDANAEKLRRAKLLPLEINETKGLTIPQKKKCLAFLYDVNEFGKDVLITAYRHTEIDLVAHSQLFAGFHLFIAHLSRLYFFHG